MLLTGYTKRISRPECLPSSENVYCIASLNEDVSEALPYLNAVLHGKEYFRDPPVVLFHLQGRIIKIGAREIVVNRLVDEEDTDLVLEWWKDKINEVWEERKDITPCYEGQVKLVLINVLRLLPKTNCRKCGQPTCTVFASQVVEGQYGAGHCPELSAENRDKLSLYLDGFSFE
ncbi:MAG: Fe-S cluster protein [Deltaproteobacteria bacterium]|nr:Fe-S cluster protein [Deltaproteobacteria bacterium]